ncbi:hypothetical protein BDV35DRAFT_345162 [Aspergillus flavus]|uniref:Uncharacterized protein n=1 Tax=Aspergillus flavus TaxID=5059 RepID=A0A5N6H4G7_ASPFL|nr:hypothetical protein BDV35DRAFT_345162 [Aspergillus flavus]
MGDENMSKLLEESVRVFLLCLWVSDLIQVLLALLGYFEVINIKENLDSGKQVSHMHTTFVLRGRLCKGARPRGRGTSFDSNANSECSATSVPGIELIISLLKRWWGFLYSRRGFDRRLTEGVRRH